MAATTPYKRDSPFLHRIWKSTIDFVSSSTNGEKPATGDQSPRPAKRRRVTDDSPGMNGFASVPALFQQPPPADSQRVLRIEVLRIWRNEGPKPATNGMANGGSPVKKDTPAIRARCKVTIFKWLPGVEMRPLYCDSQMCTIKEFCGISGVCEAVRIHLPQPFEIAAEKLFVERNDNQGFDLDDCYFILAELESFGDPNWPPRYLLNGQEDMHSQSGSPRKWSLQSQIKYAYSKGRVASQVRLRRGSGDTARILEPFWMDMDLRWTSSTMIEPIQTAESASPPDAKDSSLNGALEPLTNGHVNGRAEVLVNGQLGDEADGLVDDDELEGEATTPSRPLRNRGKPQTYNLKKLSDQARGKEPKERKKRKLGELSADGSLVTWLLPSGQRCALESWSCIHCFATHISIEQLKMHMHVHRDFKYAFDHSGRTGWRIAITNHGQQTPKSIRSYDYFEPVSADEADSEADDDESPQKTRSRSRPKSTSQIPKTVKPRETKQFIPQTSQDLYDRLSKCRLEGGSRVDEPQIDNSWLLQKHRDIIKDYSDVHPDEKEYAAEWDAFASREKATMAPHLQDVYLDFVREKANWMASTQNRMNEAMKHLAYLKARDALSEETVLEALGLARQARSGGVRHEPEAKPAATSPKIKSRSGCNVCGLSISGPNTLICSNLDCDRPMYHHDCIRDDAKIPVERGLHWRCNECYDKEKETKEAAAMAVETTAPVAATDSSNAVAANADADADAAVGTATATTTISTATAPTATAATTTTAPV
ncbi:Polycomb protein suz12-B [Apiospora arundinis]|uniref:Polycomb protein suz12-B n=1 Tax=Apiospora arundinis TaxID=335852 RepID=A0ABR2IGY1_9PEZI